MKKKIACIITLTLVSAMTVTGCSKGKDKNTETTLTEIQTETTTEATTEGYVAPEPNTEEETEEATTSDSDIAFDIENRFYLDDEGYYSFAYPVYLYHSDSILYTDTTGYVTYTTTSDMLKDTIDMTRYDDSLENVMKIVEDANKDNKVYMNWTDEQVQEGKTLKHIIYELSDGTGYSHTYIDSTREDGRIVLIHFSNIFSEASIQVFLDTFSEHPMWVSEEEANSSSTEGTTENSTKEQTESSTEEQTEQ